MTTHNARLRTAEQAAAVVLMRDNPGEFVFVGSYRTKQSAQSLGYQARRGGLVAFRGNGPFETEVREHPDDSHAVYARYVGAPIEPTVTVTVAQVEIALRGYLTQLAADFGLPPNSADLPSEALELFARLSDAAGGDAK